MIIKIIDKDMPVWIIGGAKLLEDSMDIVEEVWLSRIKSVYDCDTFFPASLLDEMFELCEVDIRIGLYLEKWCKLER